MAHKDGSSPLLVLVSVHSKYYKNVPWQLWRYHSRYPMCFKLDIPRVEKKKRESERERWTKKKGSMSLFFSCHRRTKSLVLLILSCFYVIYSYVKHTLATKVVAFTPNLAAFPTPLTAEPGKAVAPLMVPLTPDLANRIPPFPALPMSPMSVDARIELRFGSSPNGIPDMMMRFLQVRRNRSCRL